VVTRAPNLADDKEGVHLVASQSYVESAIKIVQVTYWLRRGDLLVENLGDLLVETWVTYRSGDLLVVHRLI
jgi:hypothetical protein